MQAVELKAKVEQVMAAVQALPASAQRHLIAIGGPPASGKSTLAETLQKRLQESGIPCGLVPMDGFHLDNQVLDARALRDRKGAPETFDLDGFANLLCALKTQSAVTVPTFDRENDRVIEDGQTITAEERHVIVEGNYLFLDAPGWRELQRFWSYGAFISPPLEELRQRLIERWLDNNLPMDAAVAKADGNDLVNARLVLAEQLQDSIAMELR